MRGPALSQSRATEIDFLRAYAVLAVIATHSSRVVTVGITGYHGVLLFFVISGFLITGILLDARATNGPTRGILTAFYARRFLRIFPIYYAVLFVAFVLGFQNVRAEIGWLLTYLSNWYFASRGFTGPASHLWSLAVEEQFYLFWPGSFSWFHWPHCRGRLASRYWSARRPACLSAAERPTIWLPGSQHQRFWMRWASAASWHISGEKRNVRIRSRDGHLSRVCYLLD